MDKATTEYARDLSRSTGFAVTASKSADCFVVFLGPCYCVHIRKSLSKWVARRPRALEHIGIGDTPIESLMQAKRHYEARRAEIRSRLEAPEVVAALEGR